MTQRPNILLITTDQQRYDSVGDAAPDWMQAPHYDHLRYEGVTFNRCYADCPICVPSRVTIMTGKAADKHGMLGNGRTHTVMDERNTLPTLLRAAGYQTAAIGKMHFFPMRKRHGFDEMILPQDYFDAMARAGEKPMATGLSQTELFASMSTVPEAKTLTHWTADQSADYIRSRRDPTKPWFLWTSFSKPHPPFDPPEPYWSMYQECDIEDPVRGDWQDDLPPAFARTMVTQGYDRMTPAQLRRAKAAYHGLITQVDFNLGRIFEALRDSEQHKNTLIVFTSDHGEYLGDYGAGGKCFYHEAAARVPFVLRLPRTWEDRPNWTNVDAPVTLADLLPTFVTAAGGAVPDDVDGMDLVALARGRAKPRDYVFGHGGGPGRMFYGVTDGKRKYIWFPEGDREQFFDLENDPREKRNLASVDDTKPFKQLLADHFTPRGCDLAPLPAEPIDEAALRNDVLWSFYGEHYDKDTRH